MSLSQLPSSKQVVGTREETPEAEIVCTLGIAGSLVVSQLVMVVGIVLFLPLISQIQGSGQAVEVGLNQVLPALFGALGGVFLFRSPKLGIVPLVLAFVIALVKADIPYSVSEIFHKKY